MRMDLLCRILTGESMGCRKNRKNVSPSFKTDAPVQSARPAAPFRPPPAAGGAVGSAGHCRGRLKRSRKLLRPVKQNYITNAIVVPVFMPHQCGAEIVSPVFSRISRMTASVNDSPSWTCPPGKIMPGQSFFCRSCTQTLSPLQIMHRFMNATVSALVIIRTSISLNPDLTLALIQLMAEKDDRRLSGFMSALQ